MKKYKSLDCILLIDDEESNNFLNKMIIEQVGIDAHIQETYNGLEALEFLTCTGKFSSKKEFPQPGIILLDINMPLMNGWEFLEEYKKLPAEQKGKIIMAMLTLSLNQDDMARAEANKDLIKYISKPLSLEKLEAILNRYF